MSRQKKGPAGKEKAGKRNNRTYVAVMLVMLALLAVAAIFFLNTTENRDDAYLQKAREAFLGEDYEGAVSYLRRMETAEAGQSEALMLMADCYEAMGNYDRALDTLRRLNTSDLSVANRIQNIQQKKQQQSMTEIVTVAGMEFDRGSKSAVLDGMKITDDTLAEVVQLYALDRLSLQNNYITDVSCLITLGGLDELNLAGNQIRNIEPISTLKGLRSLILDDNPISDCNVLCELSNLNTLSIVGTEPDPDSLLKLSAALPACAIRFGQRGEEELLLNCESYRLDTESLSLSDKHITDISALSGFSELKILDLSKNEISDLSPLMKLAKLERLNISDNFVSDLRPLIGLPVLNKLEAANNLISETSAVGSVNALRELDLSGNAIRDFNGLGKLENLAVLNLSNTEISDQMLSALYPLQSMQNLDLRDNDGLSDKAIGDLKSRLYGCAIATSELVYEIDFSGHVIRSDERKLFFPSGGISDLSGLNRLTRLEDLDLSGNDITTLYPFEISPSRNTLIKVNLANNHITDVLSLSSLTAVKELNLKNNQIEVVAALKRLTTLKMLNLSGNPLTWEMVNDLREALPDCTVIF